jgi:hypothetical protein
MVGAVRFFCSWSLATLLCLTSTPCRSQSLSSLRDSLPFRTLQDSFCACVNRHAGEESKDWGDAVAYALFLKLDVCNPVYRNAELLLRKTFPQKSQRKMDRELDSLIIQEGFGKCVSLWKVFLKDLPGFYKTVAMLRENPPLLQNKLPHRREQTAQMLLDYLKNGVSDSIAVLFDRRSAFDSSMTALQVVSREIKGKLVTLEMKFERKGTDSCGIGKMKLMKDGTHSLGGLRIIYKKGDTYAKIENLSAMLRENFEEEDLILSPGSGKH